MQPHPSHGLTFMSTDKEIRDTFFPVNTIAFPVQSCNICEATFHYLRDGMLLYFDSSCDCGSSTRPTISSWTELLPHRAPNV